MANTTHVAQHAVKLHKLLLLLLLPAVVAPA
jgi:hypothetical protein